MGRAEEVAEEEAIGVVIAWENIFFKNTQSVLWYHERIERIIRKNSSTLQGWDFIVFIVNIQVFKKSIQICSSYTISLVYSLNSS